MTPELRLDIIRECAIAVFGKPLVAAAWLGRPNPSVLEGNTIIANACQTENGFRETLLELGRIHHLRYGPGSQVPSPPP
jgi:hypothetical protein